MFTVVLGLAGTALILAQAGLLAHALATAARGDAAAALAGTLAALLVVVAARAAVNYGGEVAALRAAATVKSQLRRALTARSLRLGPLWLGGQRAGEIATLSTRGLDGLDSYFARYLPQLVLAVLVPIAVLARVAAADWISAVVIAVTLPLIPVFAVLVGWHTKAQTRRQWRLLATLGGHFLDVVEGLPTLKVFGRSRAQEDVIAKVTEDYRATTMSTLRVAFLSALVLELAAAVATALVAVEVGLRLLSGHLGYETALLVLLLTPEAYLPLRAVGAQFHASMEGTAAAGRVFEILDTPVPAGQQARQTGPALGRATADLRIAEIRLDGVTAAYPGRSRPALDRVSLTIAPGERIVLTGPSGAGKSTLLALLLRFMAPAAGTIEAGGGDVAGMDLRQWRRQIAWVPQQPYLFTGSAADNIALGQPGTSRDAIRRAARLAGAAEFIEALPAGYDTPLGERGLRLSAGQRQRIALARAFLRDAPLLLLDEPSAHLDPASTRLIGTAIDTALADRTVLLVSHGQGWSVGGGGRVISLDHGKLVSPAGSVPAGGPGGGDHVTSEPVNVRAPGSVPAGRRPLLRLLWLARPLRGRLALSVLAGAAATGFGVALLATSGFMLARASEHPGILAISVAVVAVRAFSVGRGVSRYLERLTSHDVAFRVLADIRVAIYRRLERLAPAGLAAFRSGDLLAALVSDVDATQDLFIRGIGPPLAAALVGAGAVTVCLLILAPAGGLLALGLLAAGAVAPALAVAASRRAARATAPARGELSAAVTDLLSGAADLHAFGAQDTALAAAAEADGKLTVLARRSAVAMGLGSGLITGLTGLTVWAVLVLGVAAVGQGTLTRVPLAVLTLTALAAFEAVTVMPAAALQLGAARSSARRVSAILDAPDPVAEPATPRPLAAGPVHVRLSGVRVRYEPDGPLALDGLDLDLPPGRRVALIGPSGAGKSTTAAVLLRFRDPAGGTVTLNGADLASYAADDVRTVIGGCPQDPHVFDATVRDNVRLGRAGGSDEELTAAAARARLLPWINSLPLGWDTRVGTHGAAMSGGERQRLALARALLADPAVLILDEPTAHLDPEARAALTADVLALTAGRATLFITHEMEGLDQVDEIIVLDHGQVTERGTHAQLMRAHGRYRQLRDAPSFWPAQPAQAGQTAQTAQTAPGT